MHTVVETPSFIAAAKSAGVSEIGGTEIVAMVADNPLIALIEGTGGFRKFRVARPGQGKSGGFRVVSYFYSADLPAFLITVFAKNQQTNLTKQERNTLAGLSSVLVATYKAKRQHK